MIYILPGMGANSKMYTGPWHQIEDCHFIDWPICKNEISISDLANRLITEFQINQGEIVIGSSLSGMVSLEIANIIDLKRVFLIGSAVNPSELSFLSKAFMPLASLPIVKISQFFASLSRDLVQQMYSKAEADFIVSMSKAILNWQGFKGDPSTVYRIHGKKDYFITCPVNSEIIDNGGHLIAISHAQRGVDFINKTLTTPPS